MSRIYDEADYLGVVDDQYRRYPYFDLRREHLGQRWNAIKNASILIAGAGWGHSIRDLMGDGFTDVWGVEASSYAVQTAAPREIPSHAHRLILGDITNRQSLNAVRTAAGLRGNQNFRACVTEDVLPCAETIDEAQLMLTELRRVSQDMIHIITPAVSGTVPGGGGSRVHQVTGREIQMPGFLWLSIEEWRDVIGPGEPIIPTDTYEVM